MFCDWGLIKHNIIFVEEDLTQIYVVVALLGLKYGDVTSTFDVAKDWSID